jgi:hypothetical protein
MKFSPSFFKLFRLRPYTPSSVCRPCFFFDSGAFLNVSSKLAALVGGRTVMAGFSMIFENGGRFLFDRR